MFINETWRLELAGAVLLPKRLPMARAFPRPFGLRLLIKIGTIVVAQEQRRLVVIKSESPH
jgi:hypothetical protein